MKRLIFVALAFLVGCNGMGSGTNRFLPAGPGQSAPDAVAAAGATTPARAERTKMHLTLTIPRRHRREHANALHPSTISSLTQSIRVVVNSGAAQVFTATPSSSACHIGTSGTVCTFVVDAPVGSDKFVITTYSGVGGTGAALDQGSAVFNVVKGENNAPSIRLGPVVSTTADTGVGSLRYAIGSANAGDTIMMLLPSGSTIVVATPLTVSNRVSIAGPGVTASARRRGEHPKATYAGISISGNGTQQIFSIQAGATVAISGLILTQGNATAGPGGAISNAGTLTLTADVLSANTTTASSPLLVRAPHTSGAHHKKHQGPAPLHRDRAIRHPHCSTVYMIGGAVYNDGALIVSGTTFDGNSVDTTKSSCIYGYGGAVFNDTNGLFFSSGNVYTNNAAYDGGAVYNYSEYGQATFTGDLFNGNLGCTAATGCATSGCSSTCTSYAEGDGAAIYDDSGPGVTITSSVFENNVVGGGTPGSYGYGGALYLDTGSPAVTGSTFTNNLAGGGVSNESEGYGGAVYWCGSSAGMHLNNDTFTGNAAGGDYYGQGGAIDTCEPFSGSNDTFTSNAAFGNGSVQSSNGEAEGGAIYDDDGMALSNCTFKSNVVTGSEEGYGGAVYDDDPSSIASSTFTSNSAVGTGATGDDSYAYGGAIYNNDGLASSNNAYTSNTATVKGADAYAAYGGAIYSDDPFSTSHDTFTSNAVVAIGGSDPEAWAGAIYNNDGMTMTGDVLTLNSATGPYESYGGALYSDDSGTAISNSAFTSNTASGGYEGWGGGIYDYDGLSMGGTLISGNTATQRGGGIYADGHETLANVTISGNRVTGGAYEDGGGGYYNYSSLTMTNSTISGNTATVAGTYAGGGGLYSDGSLSITGTTISGNAVLGSPPSGSGGGGMFIYDGGNILNSTISGNNSSRDGGGLQNDGSGLTFTNVTFFGNAATSTGGNISNTDTMYIGNSIVGGGAAATGPDASNSSTLSSNDYNVIQTAVAGTALSGTTTHNQQVNPLLLTLTNNGGPTFTIADTLASPGRADIPFAASMCNGYTGTNVDQRGFLRGGGVLGRCDAGAYEFAGVASSARQAPVPAVHGSHNHAPHGKHHIHSVRGAQQRN
jgi:predicted outer membrane repeat protein